MFKKKKAGKKKKMLATPENSPKRRGTTGGRIDRGSGVLSAGMWEVSEGTNEEEGAYRVCQLSAGVRKGDAFEVAEKA